MVPTVPLQRLLTRCHGLQFNKTIHIGDNVWIGSGVTVLPGITIGENSII
ncbi:hypothetical protein H3M12_09275 [Levilactobacillus suantsaii]|uniref:Acetyltransferase n=1 Tax=Levilactobacillus suantsaii TaxID=2292255 RepID=A0A4Q0VIH4_9LACO|nr:hypothetical protein H3M12_09275 [Levilactobacillus suantsaii]RXI78631.1 hypothetical protein DXH47_06075 [Levilactobacillus suantsaii]